MNAMWPEYPQRETFVTSKFAHHLGYLSYFLVLRSHVCETCASPTAFGLDALRHASSKTRRAITKKHRAILGETLRLGGEPPPLLPRFAIIIGETIC